MAGLFKGPKMPPPPKPVRMPNETDPAIEQAVRRTRAAALAREDSRRGTIMTSNLLDIGSGGKKLGA